MKTTIGLDNNQTSKIAQILAPLLADEFIIYLKARNAHWNVEGPDFFTAHAYFQELYTESHLIIDEVAERIRKIGQYAPATIKEYMDLTNLKENNLKKNDSLTYIKDLLEDHESIIRYLRKSIENLEKNFENDYGTIDYLTSLMMLHEKTAWMLRSHLN